MPTSPEQLLISSVLREQDFERTVEGNITSEMFHAYGEEWSWLSNYWKKHKRTPSKAAFQSSFPTFRVKAVNDTPHFIEEVRVSHTRKVLSKSLRETAELISTGDVTGAVEYLQRATIHVAAAVSPVQDTNLIDDWERIFTSVEERVTTYNETGSAGVPTGFESFDGRTGGLLPGQLIIVAARLGEGKSYTMQNMAAYGLMEGYSAHFSSLEMSRAEVGIRFHNILSGRIGKEVFKASELQQGRDFDLARYKKFLRDLKDHVSGSLTISDTRNIGIAEIAAHIERYKPDTYYLDYLTLARMQNDGGWKDIGDFTKQLKDLAGTYGTRIVAAAQLNRQAANTGLKRVAGLEDIGGSDQIGQDADGVIFLKQRSPHITQYLLGKYRGGRAGYSWWMHVDHDRGIFEEVSKNQAMDIIDKDQDQADLDDSEGPQWSSPRRVGRDKG